ncbi:TPA: hypothetical protein HA241_05260 [Candidatus Woesearchaeota archaeon]|nr:hypothetical protein [Candidatus Woesearchaeota archaeon]
MVLSEGCASLGTEYYCAAISETQAVCRNGGICSLQSSLREDDVQDADPFGLYYSRERCYGSNDPAAATTFCYYDFTPTSVNQCRSCVSVENCFDYKSQSACDANSCLSSSCQWVNSAQHDALIDYGLIIPELQIPEMVTTETGSGYCVEKEYNKDDYCSLCGSDLQTVSERGSSLFENYFCTPDVCSALGRCFSDPYGLHGKKLSSCLACGDKPSPEATCSSYATQLECTGDSTIATGGISKDGWGEITLSVDQCSWGRCAWVSDAPGSGHCIKDGDVDGADDCLSFSNDAERLACRLDVFPPQTTLTATTIPVISTTSPSLSFGAQDQESPLASLGYCLVKAGSSSPCSEFSYSSYRGTLPQDTISVNFLESQALPLDVAGETYRLLYFSKDKYSNQENVRESFIFVDTILPQFQINAINQTIGDRTKLTIFLDGMNEPMACTFTLQRVLPRGDAIVHAVGREELQKRVVFEQLEGVGFDLAVQCTDDHGNIAVQEKKYTFNLEENVNVVYPPLGGIVGSTSIAFEVETLANSHCSLYSATNIKIADFEITDGIGKKHKTTPQSGFHEKEYAREHKVVCEELLTNKVYEDVYLHFTVDTTPPLAQAVLREEGSSEQRPTQEGWELSFVEQAHVSFECANDQGFSCTAYYYCLGDQCNHARTTQFRLYSQPFVVRETTKLCYYAEDEVKNPLPQVVCGRVVVDGYGITLESPAPFYYGTQAWGVSSIPQFDWRFYTRISTEECAFDFDEQFDYSRTPPFRLLSPNGNHYFYSDFPLRTGASSYPETGGYKQVTVLCKSGEKISPPQSFFLEFDPTPPTIDSAEVHPSPVIEGGEVTLTVTTDDKTACRFDDSSQEFGTMWFGFPDRDSRKLNTTHIADYFFSLAGESGEITLYTQCQNGAGLLSNVKPVTFTIDYTLPGAILSVFPQGDFFNANTITARVETNRAASCTYRNENGTFLHFNGDGEFIHTANFVNLQEKRYQYLVRCSMEGHTVEQELSFTIDRTAPVVTGIADGNQTCGSPVALILPYTEEENISSYYYELYDLGKDRTKSTSRLSSSSESLGSSLNETRGGSSLNTSSNTSVDIPAGGTTSATRVLSSSSSARQQLLVANGTIAGTDNINLSTTGLQIDHRYVVKVKVQDKAGNFGEFAESDGFIVTPKNLSSCQDATSPRVDFVTNTSLCSSVGVELHCDDAVGCRTLRYGVEESSALCSVSRDYTGAKIQLTASSWICYSVVDNVGNNYTNKERIPVVDADGDGVFDHCDTCPNTPAGKAVGGEGCAAGEVPEEERGVDADKDSLPDFWERSYNDVGCEFNDHLADTDGDGVNDALDDYDADLFTNYEEYVEGLNPCVADPRAGAGEDRPERNETTGPDDIPRSQIQESNLIAFILLIIGLLLLVFSIIYFWYDYSQSRKTSVQSFKTSQRSMDNASSSSIRRGVAQPSSVKPISIEKVREDIAERQQRRSVFSAFEDSGLGKIDSLLQKKTSSSQKADAIIQHYSDHKEIIDKTLGRQERSIFAKLQDITAEKGASASTNTERENLFKKLRSIIDKKKGE